MINKLILGTVQFGIDYGINNKSGKPSNRNVNQILKYAYEHINTLDTAKEYGDSEERIGEFHKLNLESKFNINTKFAKKNINNLNNNLKDSLNKLNIKKIETIMFHSYDELIRNKHLIKKLVKDYKYKYFKKIGVSVYTLEELFALRDFDEIEVIQVSFNLLDNETKKGYILKVLKQKGKEIHVRSCFLQGLFFKKIVSLDGNLKHAKPYLSDLNILANETGFEIGNIALSYCLSKQYIDRVLIGVDSLLQLKQNIKWANTIIDQDILKEVDKIDVQNKIILNPSLW